MKLLLTKFAYNLFAIAFFRIWLHPCNRGHSCFQAEPATKVFVTWFAPVLVFIHLFIHGYLPQPAHIKLVKQVVKATHIIMLKSLAFPSRWRIIDNRNKLYVLSLFLYLFVQIINNKSNKEEVCYQLICSGTQKSVSNTMYLYLYNVHRFTFLFN